MNPTPVEMVLFVLVTALACLVTAILVRNRWSTEVAVARAERDALAGRVAELGARADDRRTTTELLLPLQSALSRMERQVSSLERDRVEQFGELGERLAQVSASTSALGAQTASLAGSLNASSVRGTWGEVQLRRVLEHSGMLPRCDFEEQVSAVATHDVRVRPDVAVRLPGDKVLVIDAKAPLSAFLGAQGDLTSPQERAEHLARHARALRAHVEGLAGKAYWTAFSHTPQMVVCFVPADAVLSAALSADPALYEDAMARKVVLSSPGTLLALLRTVAFTWQQDSLTGNARELLDLGNELYARLGTLGGHLSRMGGSLRKSVETYNAMVGALESRVLVTARRMHQLELAGEPGPPVPPVQVAPRPLTAAELLVDELDAVAAEAARPELLPDASPGETARRSA